MTHDVEHEDAKLREAGFDPAASPAEALARLDELRAAPGVSAGAIARALGAIASAESAAMLAEMEAGGGRARRRGAGASGGGAGGRAGAERALLARRRRRRARHMAAQATPRRRNRAPVGPANRWRGPYQRRAERAFAPRVARRT